MRLICFTLFVVLTAGCGTLRMPRVQLPAVGSASAPADAGKPAEVRGSEVSTTLPIPAGSTVEISQPSAEPETILPPFVVHLSAPTTLATTAKSTQATTGTVDTAVAVRRVDAHKETILGGARMLVGVFLIIAGAAVGFALPPALRWPLGGLCVAGAGLVLVVFADPPQWLFAGLLGAAIVVPVAYYAIQHGKRVKGAA